MNLILTLIALALLCVLFFVPGVPGTAQANYLEIAALAVLAVSVLVQIVSLVRRPSAKSKTTKSTRTEAAPLKAPGSQEAEVQAEVVQFLGRLQEKGRLVDFAMDDIASYSNEQVGAAARVVHQGCREVLQSHFDIRPVHAGEEQEQISLSDDYDAKAYRLIGNVPENPPFDGTVLHRGWKAVRVSLPRLSERANDSAAREIIAPAEVEIR